MSAPTTEEVQKALAMAERDDARASRSYSSGCDTAPGYEMALEVAEHRDALAAEVARLRKLFDDAGQGEHDVLALVDHYQAEAIEAWGEVDRLREALEIACDWWGGCGHHPDDCPVDDDPECKAAKRVNELAAKGAGR